MPPRRAKKSSVKTAEAGEVATATGMENGTGIEKQEQKRTEKGTGIEKQEPKKAEKGTGIEKQEQKKAEKGTGIEKQEQKKAEKGTGIEKQEQKKAEKGAEIQKVEQTTTRSGRVIRKRVEDEKMSPTENVTNRKRGGKQAANAKNVTENSVKTTVVVEKKGESTVPTKKQRGTRQTGAIKRADKSNGDDKQNEVIIDNDNNDNSNKDNDDNEGADNSKGNTTPSTIYEFTVKDADDQDISFVKYKGHPVLVVNVASRCGHTLKNYTQMKEILEKYHSQGLRIALFPCNQFGSQERGVSCEIKKRILDTYKMDGADIYGKISVNGANEHPFYKFLKAQQGNNEPIKWNFAKFLVDKNGLVVKRYLPTIQPKDIVDDIEKVIAGGSV